VDPEELAKKKKEELKKAAEEQQANARVKSTKKIDYDKAFEERQAKLGNVMPKAEIKDTKGMSEAAKGIILEQAQEAGLADQLFGGMGEEAPKITLNTEKEYKNFGKKVGDTLYAGAAPYRIEQFFKELCKELPTTCDSKQIKKISDSILSTYNSKLRAEKEEAQGKKKKKAAQLKGGGGKGYEMNNNPAMINDVMGSGYDDEDDYGKEAGFTRENEGDYDFM